MKKLSAQIGLIHLDKRNRSKYIALSIWLGIALFCVIQSLISHRFNNYLIFENTFRNLLQRTSFYQPYPTYHFDVNHYGPMFSVFFMPFAILPNALGFVLWNIFNCLFLFLAIETIPFKDKRYLYFLSIPCLVASSLSQQFNPIMGAFIILSYTLLNKDRGVWSTLLIVLGTFVKLYGIVGLAFFFFVKDKKTFIISLMMWSGLLFVLPMVFSSPSFIINSYRDWAMALIDKNANNISEASLDISIMGFVRSLFISIKIPNTVFLLVGLAIFGLPYLNLKAYRTVAFQLYILASVLLFTVLFSTGSEDCTYIIAIFGVGIWCVFTRFTKLRGFMIVIILIASCDFPLLLFPNVSSQYPVLLSMMSLPFFLVWLVIIYEAFTMSPGYRQNELFENGILE